MKTRFILHGGQLKLKDPRNDAYFRELNKGLDDGDKVLFIGFARRDKTERKEVYERDKGLILAQADKDITVVDATYDNLIEEIKEAKVIHICGGETSELVSDLQKYPQFVPSLAGKVVGGSSAGACLFSTYYYYSTTKTVLKGLGTLPTRLLAHYGSLEFGGTEESVDLLRACPENLELLILEECEWVVREADI